MTLWWPRDDLVMTLCLQMLPEGIVSQLTVKSISKSDEGRYICEAKIDASGEVQSTTVEIRVNGEN